MKQTIQLWGYPHDLGNPHTPPPFVHVPVVFGGQISDDTFGDIPKNLAALFWEIVSYMTTY